MGFPVTFIKLHYLLSPNPHSLFSCCKILGSPLCPAHRCLHVWCVEERWLPMPQSSYSVGRRYCRRMEDIDVDVHTWDYFHDSTASHQFFFVRLCWNGIPRARNLLHYIWYVLQLSKAQGFCFFKTHCRNFVLFLLPCYSRHFNSFQKFSVRSRVQIWIFHKFILFDLSKYNLATTQWYFDESNITRL